MGLGGITPQQALHAWSLLLSELKNGGIAAGIEELEQGITEYIHYYNHDRIKQKLKGLSPVQYRTQSLAT